MMMESFSYRGYYRTCDGNVTLIGSRWESRKEIIETYMDMFITDLMKGISSVIDIKEFTKLREVRTPNSDIRTITGIRKSNAVGLRSYLPQRETIMNIGCITQTAVRKMPFSAADLQAVKLERT